MGDPLGNPCLAGLQEIHDLVVFQRLVAVPRGPVNLGRKVVGGNAVVERQEDLLHHLATVVELTLRHVDLAQEEPRLPVVGIGGQALFAKLLGRFDAPEFLVLSGQVEESARPGVLPQFIFEFGQGTRCHQKFPMVKRNRAGLDCLNPSLFLCEWKTRWALTIAVSVVPTKP